MKAMASDINSRYQSADELLEDLENFRKHQLAVSDEPVIYDAEINEKCKVKPMSSAGELSKEDYARRRRRSKKVSTFPASPLWVFFSLPLSPSYGTTG